jgi:RNA polymerase sigma factor (sigma-70 family)
MPFDNIKSTLEQHHRDCYGWALHCCHQDRDLASEVLQDSYLKILETSRAFMGKSEFKTWAFAIIRNSAVDVFRKRKKETMLIQIEEHLHDTGYDAGMEKDLDRQLMAEFFTLGFAELSERQRQILQLIFYHDLSLNEAAQVLRLSPGAVRKYYDRAKKALADWLQKRGIAES